MVSRQFPTLKIERSIRSPAKLSKTRKEKSMNVGSGFSGMTEKEKKQYISIALDKGIVALFPILKNVKLTLWYVPKEERKSEKSPSWRLSLDQIFRPQNAQTEASTTEVATSDEEIPF